MTVKHRFKHFFCKLDHSVQFSAVPWKMGLLGGGPCEQFWQGQGCPLFDVVHPAFPLLTTAEELRSAEVARPFIPWKWGWICCSFGEQRATEAGSIPQCSKGYFSHSTFSTDSFMVSVHPRVQLHAATSVRTLKSLESMPEFGWLWKH